VPLAIPIYDFVSHSRKKETLLGNPTPIIIVDGILILHSQEVRAQLDEAIFFDTPETLRFERRLNRDVVERGRTPEGVRKQFELQVRPMHDQFVEPSKDHAHLVIKDHGDYDSILGQVCSRLQQRFSL
jgi:uridine kinase